MTGTTDEDDHESLQRHAGLDDDASTDGLHEGAVDHGYGEDAGTGTEDDDEDE